MRELDLRAWYNGDESIPPMMCDVVSFEKTSYHYDTFILDSHEHIGFEKLAVARFRVHSDEDNCIIMQYTGLKDKNKKKIYEGDIVEAWFPGMPHNMRATQEIMFVDGCFGCGSYPLKMMDLVFLEVIGNKFEGITKNI